jgi:hypothetical protein
MYKALILSGRFDLYDKYEVQGVEDAGEISPAQMADMLVVPEGLELKAYLAQHFEGRWSPLGYGEYIRGVNVWKHRYIDQDDLTLGGLLLQVNAFGTVLVEASKLGSVWSGLEQGGFGHRGINRKLHAFCNGLVMESVKDNRSLYIATIDARRAKRVLSAQARSTGIRKPGRRPERLRMDTIAQYDSGLKDYVWDRMALNEIRQACICGPAYQTFKSNGWDQTFWAIQCMHRFYKKNKISLVGPAKIFWKAHPQPECRNIPDLIAKHIKGLRGRIATLEKQKIDSKHVSQNIALLQQIRRLLIQTMPKGKKCVPSK